MSSVQITDTQLGSQTAALPDIQIGFPELPAVGSPIHLKVLGEWIKDCDLSHQCYPNINTFIPTRLLNVSSADSGVMQLIVPGEAHIKSGRYVALSHRWGSPQRDGLFCTYRSNIEELKRSIWVASLPPTFQDAVYVTHGLGLKYLWIDSLCIVQDDATDWETESKLMERVFSSAYCTIAASCSSGSGDSFLKPRSLRHSVAIQGPESSDSLYYVCETTDDFYQDVDQSELNNRGWVLQERALSRRTIYFAERQSYWECGEGVRCETMTRMKK
jgi:hypothetical protein